LGERRRVHPHDFPDIPVGILDAAAEHEAMILRRVRVGASPHSLDLRERGVHREHGHFGRHDKAQDQRLAGHQLDCEQLRAQERRPERGSETEIGYQGGPELRPRRRRNAVGLRDT